jgi:uncharacterized protein
VTGELPRFEEDFFGDENVFDKDDPRATGHGRSADNPVFLSAKMHEEPARVVSFARARSGWGTGDVSCVAMDDPPDRALTSCAPVVRQRTVADASSVNIRWGIAAMMAKVVRWVLAGAENMAESRCRSKDTIVHTAATAFVASRAIFWVFLPALEPGLPCWHRGYLLRKASVFAMAGALLAFVRFGERRPWSSIGWHRDRWGCAVASGLLGAVACFAAVALCIVVAHAVHWKVGQQQPPKWDPPLWAVAITVLRAGVTEELFYRGYALERLMTLTGSRRLAAVLTVVPFALFHYRQGPAVILIAAVAASILTVLYLRRRSLPTVMVTHFIVDFVPNVLLPMFGVG